MNDYIGAFVLFVIVVVFSLGMMFGFSMGTNHVLDDLTNYGSYIDKEHRFKVVRGEP